MNGRQLSSWMMGAKFQLIFSLTNIANGVATCQHCFLLWQNCPLGFQKLTTFLIDPLSNLAHSSCVWLQVHQKRSELVILIRKNNSVKITTFSFVPATVQDFIAKEKH
jgi:hypothetical protein